MYKKKKKDSIVRSQRIEIYPTDNQKILLQKSFDIRRFAWNKGLMEWNFMYEEFKKTRNINDYPTGRKIRDKYTNEVKPKYPWMSEPSKEAAQEAFDDLQDAFDKYRDYKKSTWLKKLHHSKDFIPKVGHPKFKSKIYDRDRYREVSTSGKYPSILWKQNRLYLPKFKRKNYLKTSTLCRYPQGKLKRVVISRSGDRYYASCLFEFKKVPVQHTLTKVNHTQPKVGVDVGIKTLAALNTGKNFVGADVKQINKRIKRLQQQRSRQKFGSSNRSKTIIKLDRAYRRKANMLNDQLHKTTTWLVTHYDQINIEDMRVSNMIKNHNLAGSLADAQFYNFKIYLQYKAKYIKQQENRIVNIQTVNPNNTTQKCSRCGFKQTKYLDLTVRTMRCENCGFIKDRDTNAAINIYNLA